MFTSNWEVLNTMILAQHLFIKIGYNKPSKYLSWRALETVCSHLKNFFLSYKNLKVFSNTTQQGSSMKEDIEILMAVQFWVSN